MVDQSTIVCPTNSLYLFLDSETRSRNTYLVYRGNYSFLSIWLVRTLRQFPRMVWRPSEHVHTYSTIRVGRRYTVMISLDKINDGRRRHSINNVRPFDELHFPVSVIRRNWKTSTVTIDFYISLVEFLTVFTSSFPPRVLWSSRTFTSR